jgi:HEAT repeat protein
VLAASVDRCEAADRQLEVSDHQQASKAPSRWQQLDLALSDLAPDSQRARQLVPGLIAAAQDPETPDVLRQRSILMLGRIGKPAEAAIPVFLRLLDEYRQAESSTTASPTAEQAAHRRVWLLDSLGDFDEAANDAVPVLRRDLFDRSRSVDDRVHIADVLGQIGTVSAVQALADALRQWPPGTPPSEQLVKRTIVDCIGLSGPAGVVGLPALLRTIEDPDSSIRRKVCEATTLFGPAGELATDALVERLVLDDVPAVQDAAADTLAAIGPVSVPVLIRLLKSGEPDIQWRAARSLGRLGRNASSSLDALEATVHSARSTSAVEAANPEAVADTELQSLVRIEALEAHWRISADTTGIFRELIRELGNEHRQIRIRASRLLIEPEVLPVDLLAEIQDLASSDFPAARAAAYVLRNRGASAP